MRARYLLGTLVLAGCLGSCSRAAPRASTGPAALQPSTLSAASSAPDATSARAPNLGDRTDQFLVQLDSGEIVLRSRASSGLQVLAAHADAALYQAALELVWFRDGPELRVLDLRALDTQAVVVASGLPDVNRLSIDHPVHASETEDGCDLEAVSLTWSEAPKIEAPLSKPPGLRIEDVAWLRAQRARPAQPIGQRREFGSAQLRLPKKLLDCEEREACGSAVPFGSHGAALVRVLNKMGGDCWRRACLLRDPQTGLFASPLRGEVWASAEKTEKGPCGLFMFDSSETAFLQGNSLCLPEQPCQELGGHALGWLVTGPTVGAAGIP